MSDEKRAAYPNILFKGGTMSAAFQTQMKEREHNAKLRRAHQDKQVAMSQQGVTSDGGVARLGSTRFITQDAPRLILNYRGYNQEGISEVTFVPRQDKPSEMEMMFTLVCIGCLKRGIRLDEAQLMIRNSHRPFWIDDRPENKRPRMVENFGMVTPAGLVTTKDIIRCTNVGCGWAVRVIDSQVEEV